MKKIIPILIFLCTAFSGIGVAQMTRGGSEKNYDRFRIKYDTIVTERKVLENGSIYNPMNNYSSLHIGLAKGLGFSTGLPTRNEYNNSPYYGEPIASGKIGLQSGFTIQFETHNDLKGINKNLIRMLDSHLKFGFGYTGLSQNWTGIYSNENGLDGTETLYRDLLEAANYKNYHLINIDLGLGMSFYPVSTMKNFAIDATLGFRMNLFFGGGVTSSIDESDDMGGNLEYNLDIYDYDGGTIGFSNYLKIAARYSNFMVFLQYNTGVNLADLSKNQNTIEESATYSYQNSLMGIYDYDSYNTSYERDDQLRLNNLQFGIGLTF